MENVLYKEYLNSIYQNSKTAIEAYENVIPAATDKTFKNILAKNQSDFSVIAKECEILARSDKFEIKDNGFLEKAKMWTTTKMATLTNNSTRNIAEMFLLGTHMGIIQCYKDKKDYNKVSPELDDLTDRLMHLLETVYENMKDYL